MSRLAKSNITLGDKVTVTEHGNLLTLKGPKGEEKVRLSPRIKLRIGEREIKVEMQGEDKQTRADAGTAWSLIQNAIQGVTEGFTRVMEIEGVGYRAAVEGKNLTLSLGYAHPVRFPIPDGAAVVVDKNVITVSGTNKDLVGRTAAQIRALKKPEPYKGKGIHYQGEVIRRKAGKKAAATTGAA